MDAPVKRTIAMTIMLLVACIVSVGIAGCGDVNWFPDDSSSSGTAPTAFTFANKESVALSTTVQSDTVTLSGFTGALAVTVSGGEYSVNGGTFTSSTGTVLPNQSLRVQHTSASTASTSTTTTITVGTYTTTFTSITTSS